MREVLGRGGLCDVYRVYDEDLRREAAVKCLRPDYLTIQPILDAFARETRIWVGFDPHPNVVTAIRVVHPQAARVGIEMELVGPFRNVGRSLREVAPRLRATKELPEQRSLQWAIQLADGMIYARAAGLECHGDLKLDNALVSSEGVAKITDFGLARVLPESPAGRRRRWWRKWKQGVPDPTDERQAGSLAYLAPELFSPSHPRDERGDIYAFGILVFELLVGTHPYSGASDLLRASGAPLRRDRAAWQRVHASESARPNFSAAADLLESCLEKRPANRPPTFQSVRDALAALYSPLYGDAATPAAPTPLTAAEHTLRAQTFYFTWRDDVRSRAHLAAALSLDPYDPVAVALQATQLADAGEDELALRTIQSARAFAPDSIHVLFALAGIHKRLNRPEEAAASLRQVLVLDRQFLPAMLNLAEIYQLIAQDDEDLRMIDRALALSPRSAAAWQIRARSLMMRRRFREARSSLERARECDPSSASVRADLERVDRAIDGTRSLPLAMAGAISLAVSYAAAWDRLPELPDSATKYLVMAVTAVVIGVQVSGSMRRGTSAAPPQAGATWLTDEHLARRALARPVGLLVTIGALVGVLASAGPAPIESLWADVPIALLAYIGGAALWYGGGVSRWA